MRAISAPLLATLLLAACGNNAAPPAAEPVRPALVQKLAPVAGSAVNTYPGEIRARHETDMAFRIPGKIVAREVEVGSTVAAGTVLARLDPADTGLRLSQAEAQLALALADVKRLRELRTKNFISQSALEAKETEFKSVAAQADLARNQAAYAVLRADRPGVVTAVNAEQGQVVAAGQPVVRLARPEELEVVVDIAENQLQALRAAKQISIMLWASPGKRYRGRLRELAPAADAATRTFRARISVLEPDAEVRLGMTANIVLGDNAGAEIFILPLSALTRNDGKPAVWVFDPATQTVAPRSVSLSDFSGEDQVNIADGLKAGEIVVIAGVHKLRAGQKVKPETTSTEPL
ncbi:Efflux transporter periplasmic adaptor subunit [Georgfuchsia toluolica]|uniref:Efflux transporter periplasmic adaptor subunit n=1 Tax=Georgfuchsia toluolica TaxID=424218 RepID=A0A916J997_9PROT|nr:efflux RND transporter periplasmic adaptor subunit [Georgfuchsia toluolica]CAG4884706.1 Efflux transporter periplasmic adaptor subunit [Georgfuchsia toluolica]